MVPFVHWSFFFPCINRRRMQLCSYIPFLNHICRPLLWSIHRSGQPHPAHSCADDHSTHQEPHHRPEREGCKYDESALQVASNTWKTNACFQSAVMKSILTVFFFCLSRMIDWLSWPLAHHVDTWVIALLKGLSAVQKFTILIDVTLLKIELVCNGSHWSWLILTLRSTQKLQPSLSKAKENLFTLSFIEA